MAIFFIFFYEKNGPHFGIIGSANQPIGPKETVRVKSIKSSVHRKFHALPMLRFNDQKLTSFAGIVLWQKLLLQLDVKASLIRCFSHLPGGTYGHGVIMLLLVVHLVLGYRRLQDMRYYADDPLVPRALGLSKLPDVATVSRQMATMDEACVTNLRRYNRDLVLDRLVKLNTARITLDFDGSVIGTTRFAEGTAVGFNRKKKGQRSYYPLFCTVAQSGQVLDVCHRPGNVHDANGAKAFIKGCIEALRARLPTVLIEVRMDSAFFSDEIVSMLDELNVQYTISVPFERLAALKQQIEGRKRWRRMNWRCGYFETHWKPKSWKRKRRFICLRQKDRLQHKGPIQLDLFIPHDYDYEFKVIVTNKTLGARRVLTYHNGRGAQEGLFAELKSQIQMDYVPTRRQAGNRAFLMAALLAHNLNRELQMQCRPAARKTTEKRAPLWRFEQLGTLRKKIIQRAGRLTNPGGKLTLTMSANDAVQKELLNYLDRLQLAAT